MYSEKALHQREPFYKARRKDAALRDIAYDMDAVINATSAIKDAVNRVSGKYDLPNGWAQQRFCKDGGLYRETGGVFCLLIKRAKEERKDNR